MYQNIKKIRTIRGDMLIDYNSIDNLPTNFESINNKIALIDNSVTDEQYPTATAVKDYVINKVFPPPITTIPTTLTPNKQYNFGEVTELALAFPTVAEDGDVIYVTFITGETATALTIDTTNTCDIEFVPEAHTGYEVFGKFNGSIWIVNYSEYTVSEV